MKIHVKCFLGLCLKGQNALCTECGTHPPGRALPTKTLKTSQQAKFNIGKPKKSDYIEPTIKP